jgi:hypothetical protein
MAINVNSNLIYITTKIKLKNNNILNKLWMDNWFKIKGFVSHYVPPYTTIKVRVGAMGVQTPLPTINQLYIGVQLYSWWRPEEIIDLSQVTSKLKLYDLAIAMSGIELTTLAISYIDCISRGKSNYLTIMERHPTYVTTICKNRIINVSPFNTNTLNVCICV